MFYDGCSDNVDEIADTVTSGIQFSEHNLIQTKTFRIFVQIISHGSTKKGILNEKNMRFRYEIVHQLED